jgi:itaconate CoA-transferase
VQNEREFARFCEVVLGKPELAGDPRFASGPARLANREALHAEIARVFSGFTAGQALQKLDAADIANARLNTMDEFWRHAQLASRGRWTEVGSPAGSIAALKPPFNLSQFEPRMDPVPALGQHTHAILGELGYGEDARGRLARSGAI